MTKFRPARDELQLPWCLGFHSTLRVIGANADLGSAPERQTMGRPPTHGPVFRRRVVETESVAQWAASHPKTFRKVTGRQGFQGSLSSRFAVWRVCDAYRAVASVKPQEAGWLIAEWPLERSDAHGDFLLKLGGRNIPTQLGSARKTRLES